MLAALTSKVILLEPHRGQSATSSAIVTPHKETYTGTGKEMTKNFKLNETSSADFDMRLLSLLLFEIYCFLKFRHFIVFSKKFDCHRISFS
jgi:hypothetical protein